MKQCFNSLAGQQYNAGTVCAELVNGASGDMVRITYDTGNSGYCLTEVQAYFGDSIPSNGAGNPQPGQFTAKNTTMPAGCIKTATLISPLEPTCSSTSTYTNRAFKLAAHSSVVLVGGGGGQTAWSTGVDVTNGGSWATYSAVSVSCACIVPTKAPTKAPTKSPTKVRTFGFDPLCSLYFLPRRFLTNPAPLMTSGTHEEAY